MTQRRSAVALAVLLGAAGDPAVKVHAQQAKPQQILVVVSTANPVESLDLARVRRIFLREQTTWAQGWPIATFLRSSENPIRADFSVAVLGKEPGQMAEYWLNLQLTRGLDPPKICRTSSLMKQYLDRLKGAIGYVYEVELMDGMKVVARINPKRRAK